MLSILTFYFNFYKEFQKKSIKIYKSMKWLSKSEKKGKNVEIGVGNLGIFKKKHVGIFM